MTRVRKRDEHESGFTLIELLLTVVMLGVLVGIGISAYTTLFYKNDLDVAKNQTALSMGRASFLSRAAYGDTTWGVKILSGSVIVFKGASYAARDTSSDEVYSIPSSITISGTTEYVFAKMTGLPTSTGSVTLTATSGDSKTITINAKGTVQY